MRPIDVTGWIRDALPDGTIVLTAPPVHPGFARERHAQLRIRRGVPLVRCSDRAERFVTQSGEYGMLYVEQVSHADQPTHRATACVIGDEQMLCIEGTAASPNIVPLVRDLAIECAWMGAADRIRMVPYRPPVGWFGVRRELATIWLPPDAPRDSATLVVGDAVPRGPAERTHALLWPLDPPTGAKRTVLDGTALLATVATWTQADRHYATAELGTAQWCIRIGLRAGTARQLAVLHDLARSIELPPSPSSAAPARTELHRWM